MNFLITVLLFLLTPLLVIAQEAVPAVTNEQFLLFLAASIGGIGGLKTLGIVQVAAQVFMKFLGTPWADSLTKKNGAIKITIYLVFVIVAGVAGLMLKDGLTIGAALLHSTTLAAFGVLANQLWKQYFEKKD